MTKLVDASRCSVISRLRAVLLLLLFATSATTLLAQTSTDKKFSIICDGTPLASALTQIENLSGYKISFSTEEVQEFKVSVNLKDCDAQTAVKAVLNGLPFTYTVQNTTIAIVKNDKSASPDLGGKRKVLGVVLDEEKKPLPGATIRIDDNARFFTTTDADGRFQMNIPVSSKLMTITFLGMKTQKIQIGPNNQYRIIMEEGSIQTSEVVVTGIVTRKKESFTGSSASFTGDELRSVSLANPIAALKTLDPSFNLIDNTAIGSDPNQLPNIEIRGKSSLLSTKSDLTSDPNQPLFILDGFETTLETIYNLDVHRIASMTVLKDAASTAIYGSKAANGVVVVETVKPKAGKLMLNYNGSLNIDYPDLTSYNLMNASEKLEFERLAGKYDASTNGWTAASDYDLTQLYNGHLADVKSGVNTYWLSQPLRTVANQKHYLYAQGGEGGFTFGIGLGYNQQNGVMKKSNRGTYSGNIDLVYRVKKFQFSNKFSADVTNLENPIVSFSEYAQTNPYYRMYNTDGSISRWLEYNDYVKAANPLWNDSQNSYNKGKKLQLTNYFIMEYTPIADLKLRARAGITHATNQSNIFYSPNDTRFDNTDVLKKGSYTHATAETNKYEGEFTAVYGHLFHEIHLLNIAAGAYLLHQSAITQGYSVVGFPDGDFVYPSFGNSYPEGGKPTYYETISRSVSAYATANYSIKDRYLLDLSYRVNGSSVFGSTKRYIGTWSTGIGWNLHKEQFIQDLIPGVTMFKLHASIGNPGNQNFDSSSSLTTFAYSYSSYNYFGLSTVLQQLGNKNLKWQTTFDQNYGLDLTLFKDRLNIVVDYYRKKTDPLLISIDLPSSTGVTSMYTNIGNQTGTGFIASATYYIIRKPQRRFLWSVRATINTQTSKLGGIGNSLETVNQSNQSRSTRRYYDGADPDDIWAVRSAGIDPATGREIYITKDGKYTYDFSYDDEVIVGNTRDKVQGILGTSFSYEGFSLSASFRYRLGAKAFNQSLYDKVENITLSGLNYNQDKRALYDRWQNVGDYAKFKNIANTTTTPISSRFVQRDNSLSLESFQVGYEFSSRIASKLGMSLLRVSAYMNDIFRISTMKQERGTSYPYQRSITFGLSFNL